MVIMGLNKKEREVIEGSIFDAHFAASKYIESGKDIHKKLLEISVKEAIDTLQLLSGAVKEDEMVGNYKIHLLVPLQLLELIDKREGNESK
tara:strand:+ start:966 stop:1238 length:273 start_codon:yes stop_codon:yes gene_type:complete